MEDAGQANGLMAVVPQGFQAVAEPIVGVGERSGLGTHFFVCNGKEWRVHESLSGHLNPAFRGNYSIQIVTAEFGGFRADHVEGRDDAEPSEIRQRDWLSRYSHFIRVRDAKFLSGAMKNGLSLNQLMDELGSSSFSSTQRNASKGSGNTDPRKAYTQQSFVELTGEGYAWLNQNLERAFRHHGAVSSDSLDQVDSVGFVDDEPDNADASPLFSGEDFERE